MDNSILEPTYHLLWLTFGIFPIIAGADKFANLLTNWEKYLDTAAGRMVPFAPRTFMMIVGVAEIIAGIIVLIIPAIGGLIVGAWLALIALTLITNEHGAFLDIASNCSIFVSISCNGPVRLVHNSYLCRRSCAGEAFILKSGKWC